MEKLRQQAADLLMSVWRTIPSDYKSRYRMSIWDQFESQVRSAAYTSNLARFANSLCSKLQCVPGRNKDERDIALEILNSGQDRALLKMLREETTLIVLMVRVANEQRRDDWLSEYGIESDKEE